MVWRGHGSAIFLEFGRLTPQLKRDGSAANATGDFMAMIEWSWRIEMETAILCGSWSDEETWDEAFRSLVGREVTDVSLHGRLPELSIALTGGFYVVSFITTDGQPVWTFFDKVSDGKKNSFIYVENGQITEGRATESSAQDRRKLSKPEKD